MTRTRQESESENEDTQERARKRLKTTKNGNGSEATSSKWKRAGYIKTITMVNFMCHEQLELDFIPGMNFITGKNGSGKSTILTAISTCLGGRASATNRASSLKALIKEGKDSAKLIITLHNKGDGAYQPKVFGDLIIVERVIKDTAATTKIKNSAGHTVSTVARDLAKMLDHFSIHVDNPFAILTQDTARSFLTSSSASDKYEHLKKAMLMDKIEFFQSGSSENVDATREKFQVMAENYRAKKKRHDALKKKHARFEHAHFARQQRDQLRAQVIWSEVEELDEQIEDKQNGITKAELHVEQLRELAEGGDEQHNELSRQAGRLEAEHDNITREQIPIDEANQRLNAKIREHEKELDKSKKEFEEKRKSHLAAKKSLQNYEEEKANVMSRDLDEERRELQSKFDSAKSKKQDLEREHDEYDSEYKKLESEMETVNEEVGNLKNRVESKRQEIQKLEDQVKSSHRLSAYGRTFPEFHKEFEKTKFKENPLGPLGLFVRLKDKKWSPVLEKRLSDSLDSFVVTNNEDRQKLLNLLNKHRLSKQVLLRKVDNFDFSRSIPDAKYTTVLDVLQIENERVIRCLVDLNRVESTILIADRGEATAELSKEPPRVSQCYAIHKINKNEGHVISKAGRKVDPIFHTNSLPKMSEDISETIDQWKRELSEAKAMLPRYSEEYSKTEEKRQKMRSTITELKSKLRTKISAIQRAETEINKLQQEIEERESDNVSGELDLIEGHIAEAKMELVMITGQLTERTEKLAEISNKVEELKAEKAALREQSADVAARAADAQRKVESKQKEIQQLLHAKSRANDNLQQEEMKIEAMREHVEVVRQERAAREAQALELHPERVELEVADGMTREDAREAANAKVEKITAILRSLMESRESAQQVMDDLKQAQEELEEAQKVYKDYRSYMAAAVTGLDSREKHHGRVRELTLSNVRRFFTKSLEQRGFQGELLVDHVNQKLDLKVKTANGEAEQDVNTLSGGEKSYSQLALLTAIWQAMDLKLLALDEFDVFMDKVNRRVSLLLVMRVLREMTQTQSIFITPQELENSEIDFTAADVHVVRMDDPERGVVGQE